MPLRYAPFNLKLIRVIGFCVMFILTFGLFCSDATVAMAADDGQNAQTPLCRFGVNVDSRVSDIAALDTAPLRIGWYQNYSTATSPSRPNGAEYTQVIRLAQDVNDKFSYSPNQSQIEAVIDLNPGATWFVGNEPDRHQEAQDDITPPVYAEAYHELYHLIKGRDPTARVFPGSIVQATEVRLRYLDMILSHYSETYGVPMPADGWSIHGFILNEVNKENNPDNLPEWGAEIPPGMDDSTGLLIDAQDHDDMVLFRMHVEQFRSWMAGRGYRNMPLYLSEYGVLFPSGLGFDPDFTDGRINSFMDQTFQYLLTASDARTGYPADGNRLVQRLSWYSANDKIFNGYLFDEDNGFQPSLMGQNYAQYASGVTADQDLFPVNVYVHPHAPLVQDGPADLTIHAQIANSGNELQETDAVVRFYNGDPDAGGTQIGEAQALSVGGCGATKTAKVLLPSVTPGMYQFYAEVEAVSATDINPDNNKASVHVLFATNRLFAPLIVR